MAKFALTTALGEHQTLPLLFQDLELTGTSSTEVETTAQSGARIVYHGADLATPEGEDRSGTVTSVEFFNASSQLVMTVSKGQFQFGDLNITDILQLLGDLQAGKDKIVGSTIGDFLLTEDNPGNDVVLAGRGDDILRFSDGSNRFDGGKGFDTLFYNFTLQQAEDFGLSGIKANLAIGKVTNPWGKTDRVENIEALFGTIMRDVVIGSRANETFTAAGGNDRFTGGKGNDTLVYGAGDAADVFTDFGKGKDHIDLNFFFNIHSFDELKAFMYQDGRNAVINFNNGDTLTFLNFKKSHFHESDFSSDYFV